MQERASDRVLVLLSTKGLRFSEIRDALQKPDKTIGMVLKNLQNQGLITKNEERKYILTKDGQLALEQAQESKARSSLFEIFKKLLIREPELSLEERESIQHALSPCWVLPTLDQMVERMIIENEKLKDISTSVDYRFGELMLDYVLTFLSLADKVNELRRYSFLKVAEVYGGGAKKGEELAKTAEKMMNSSVATLELFTDVDRIPSILADIKARLKGLQEYKSLESVYKFIDTEVQIIEMEYERFKELRNKFYQELEARTQKPSAKSKENPDPLPS